MNWLKKIFGFGNEKKRGKNKRTSDRYYSRPYRDNNGGDNGSFGIARPENYPSNDYIYPEKSIEPKDTSLYHRDENVHVNHDSFRHNDFNHTHSHDSNSYHDSPYDSAGGE